MAYNNWVLHYKIPYFLQFIQNKYFFDKYGMDNTGVLSTLSNSGNTTLEIPGTKAGNKIEVALVR